jgi:uncharacterized RDD family membrane protein YckC
MFTILGADGKEYGPVPTAKVHEWINGGRANLTTKARRDGETEWKTLGDFPEFTGSGTMPPPVAPVGATPTATASSADPQPELADRGVRLGSFLLDYLLSLICALPGLIILGPIFISAVLAKSQNRQPDFSGIAAGRLLLGLGVLGCISLLLLVVQVWLLSTRGQTLGKIVTGIKVVRVPDSAPAGFVHGWLLRNFVPGIIRIIPWIGLLFFLVDSCFVFSGERRCIHDLIAGTKVIKAPKAG